MKKIYLCMFMFIVAFFGGIVATAEERNFQEIQAESVSVDDGKLTVFSDSYFEFECFYYYDGTHEDCYVSNKLNFVDASIEIFYCILKQNTSYSNFEGKIYFKYINLSNIYILNFSLGNYDFSKLYIEDINDDFYEEYCDISSYLEYLFIKESELEVIDISSIGQISSFVLSPDINIEDPGDLPGGGGTGNTDTTSFEYAKTLTSSDNELDQYNPSGSSSYNNDGSRKNDDIIKIIPKDCFENQASYYYIGKEYGFYITTYEYGNNNKSIVFIFDIDTVVPGEGAVSCDCTVTITPKIQYVYEYSPSTLLVLPISSETHYNIKNVGVAFNIQNRDIPNYGSSNYDVNEDVGDYIISSNYNYLGSGSIIPDQSFYYDSVQFAIGFIPYIGTTTAIANYAWSILSNLNSGYYDMLITEREQASPMYYNESFENDWPTHIREYGGLIKSLNVKPTNQGGFIKNPVIFGTKTGSDFVSATIKIDNYGGSEKNVYSQLFLGVSVDILYDNSYYFGGNPVNDYDVIVLDVENAFYYGEYKAY